MLHRQEHSVEEGSIVRIVGIIVVMVVLGFFIVCRYILFSGDENEMTRAARQKVTLPDSGKVMDIGHVAKGATLINKILNCQRALLTTCLPFMMW
jgi:hypothetical protein